MDLLRLPRLLVYRRLGFWKLPAVFTCFTRVNRIGALQAARIGTRGARRGSDAAAPLPILFLVSAQRPAQRFVAP